LKRTVPAGLAGLALTLLALAGDNVPCRAETTVILIRHAERLGDADVLSPDGVERARVVRDMLKSVDLAAVYTTDTKRAKDTAAPLLEARGIDGKLYDPKDLAGFAKKLRTDHRDRAVLVVGHTNTVPALIRELGSKAVIDIPDVAYDNLFVLTAPDTGEAALLHLHFAY
jgi:broad specificity phosphatase PhoE